MCCASDWADLRHENHISVLEGNGSFPAKMGIKALLTSIWQEHAHFRASQKLLVILDK